MNKRGSGILLHIISLPSPYGIGDLGPSAFKFVDFLSKSNQCYWQVLPLNPSDNRGEFSPYSSLSTHALNPLLISPDNLYEDGYIEKNDLHITPDLNPYRVSYTYVSAFKAHLLEKAFLVAYEKGFTNEFELFCKQHSKWLNEHALYSALSSRFNKQPWNLWPEEICNRTIPGLKNISLKLEREILKEKFIQYLLLYQWIRLKKYSNQKGIQLIGDLPMFVSYDSVDVWANKSYFKLTQENSAQFFSGAPADRFNNRGQIWHNPVYNWEVLQQRRYDWWITRFNRSFELFDILRIDHFRGLVAYWEIPVQHADATKGYWRHVPVDDFFNEMIKHFPCFPVIAEDLGTITADVSETMIRLGFPGTKVLIFAFESDAPHHPYLPHNYSKHCMACTGTHDTNTIRGWFEKDASESELNRLFSYIGEKVTSDTIHWKAIRLLMISPADMVIFPLQDVLGQDASTRMNIPGSKNDNWQYRFTQEQITEELTKKLAEITYIFGRS